MPAASESDVASSKPSSPTPHMLAKVGAMFLLGLCYLAYGHGATRCLIVFSMAIAVCVLLTS